MEIWKDVVGFEGYYQVSNLGRVRSLDRVVPDSRGATKSLKGRVKLQRVDKYGYPGVRLNINCRHIHSTVHRLVAKAFIPNPENCEAIIHKDEDKTNNHVENLEWCTIEYNNNYGTRNKRVSISQRNRPDLSKPVLQYTLDGQFVKEYPSLAEAARAVCGMYSNIKSCANGGFYSRKRDKWVNVNHSMGYKWRWVS